MNKRNFIKTFSLAGLAIPLAFEKLFAENGTEFFTKNISDDEFWVSMRNQYQLKTDYINLENGYYNLMPEPILNEYMKQLKMMNQEASYYKRTKMADDKIMVREQVAALVGCDKEELIITRNTTEAIDTVICGIDWKAGDEVIFAEQDYGAMIDMFKQQAKRYGIINKVVSVPNHPKNDEELIELYQQQITAKTRLIMISHMINITGQILPVRKICDMAHSKGVKVLVDGAHAIAHFQFKISDLNCDYYASSLHKWLSVPLGAGMLYVQKNNIEELWPLYGESGYPQNDIRKLNHTGTHPMHTELTIPFAIEFYNKIGRARKEERLRFLTQYWTNKLSNNKKVIINTPNSPERSCGIANVGIEGMKPALMAETLLKKYQIWTVAIDGAGVHGCRITPNVYTTTNELDRLVYAVNEMAV
ncbi:MAG: aminotransferase class V-fold PLP-dependent enzyme [Bacteroidota bacterium]|jgi:selenocysteine lyase/cysteine desulfurase